MRLCVKLSKFETSLYIVSNRNDSIIYIKSNLLLADTLSVPSGKIQSSSRTTFRLSISTSLVTLSSFETFCIECPDSGIDSKIIQTQWKFNFSFNIFSIYVFCILKLAKKNIRYIMTSSPLEDKSYFLYRML